ncbi:MAG TPA: trimeric intracellular cation channel family protein [Candidatus Luteococcus avicola]|nr:trimeric intracellular cation channel family protein [Candidatus Luteococcus avicola]
MLLVELIGVFAFALSGGLAGVRRRFDIFGILVLAVLTALGGGMVRDVLLGITPPRGISDLNLIGTALVGGLVTFWFSGTLARARRVILVADALGLGAFAVTGAAVAIEAGYPGVEAIAVGMITAVGGGVLRDVLSGQVPSVFGRELYAVPALLGALLTDCAYRFGWFDGWVQWMLVLLVFGLRVLALRFCWKTPLPRRLAH